MSSTKFLPLGVSVGISILTGGYFVGSNIDRMTVLCQEFDGLKTEHRILKEKVYDIHTRVCVIDEKISKILDNKKY